jgi:deoxyribonuclease-4
LRIGAHESTAGGLHSAFARGEADGCEALQIFTGYNTRWAERPLDDVEASLFLSEAARTGGVPLLSHCCYLINLASPAQSLWQRSVDALCGELDRCETLGILGAVLHPGSHMGAGEREGLDRVAAALGEVHRRTAGYRARVLLENTAGQGNTLGHRFEHLGWLLDHTPDGERLGVCVDTCHALAAGYDLALDYEQTLAELQRHVGLDRVLAFHLNDSRRELGSRVDRHTHVGEGELGLAPFARLVNDPRFADVPGIVETPPLPDGKSSFAKNIRRLKRLRR